MSEKVKTFEKDYNRFQSQRTRYESRIAELENNLFLKKKKR